MDSNRGTVVTAVEDKKEDDGKKGGRGCGCWILLLLLLVGGGAASAGLFGMVLLRAETPLPGEAEMANIAKKTLMIPSEYGDMRLPSEFLDPNDRSKIKPETVASGTELFLTQCAICHGGSARGDGPLGKTMYPKANNLRDAATQNKSDGQLYWLIAHGINLTGMPAWGTEYGGPNGDREIWMLVAYVRSLQGQQ